MSAVMVSMAVLIRTFSYGILAVRGHVVLLNKKYIYSYLKCIVYNNLLKPRQSFRITLYSRHVI